ncbi:glutaredoxin [Candidatus Thorarchaeota archaeon]|nr:MAG: glutaredoxin [Candidatus Thorarchaeota archaeon]
MVVEMDEGTREQVQEMFTDLEEDVTLHVFLKDHDCLYCNDTREIAEQVAELSEKVHTEFHVGEVEDSLAKEFGIRFSPAIVVHGKDEYKIRFYGIPAGHEFGALIGTILDASTGAVPLPPDMIEDIRAIDRPIHIQVFTTPQCPYCPKMVRMANQAAILNPLIESDMIESLEFKELAQQYEVFGVPKTVLNETIFIEGMPEPEMFIDKLFDAAD